MRATPGRKLRRGLVACILAATSGATLHDTVLAASAAKDAQKEQVDVTGVIRAQPRLVEQALGSLRPGVEGEVELFAILAAYYPDEGVFLREVEAIRPILEERFGAEGRVLTLANSVEYPRRFPMANVMNLALAVNAVAAEMNLGEDVLLVYLTSHGLDGALSAGEWAVGTPPLRAEELARIFDRAEIPNVAAVISACRSGSFLPSLAAPDRLVVTAAAADRNSFGCSDKRAWTYFGEAFFARALAETLDLREAYARAAALVREWETASDFVPSEPQMAVGTRIAGALERLAKDAGAP